MKTIQEMYQEKCMSADQLLELVQSRDYIFCAQAAGEPEAILSHMQHLKQTGVKDVILHTCLPIKDYPVFHDPEMQGVMFHHGRFFNANLRRAQEEKLVSDIPQHSTTALKKSLYRAKYEGRRPVVIATVAPMDSHGYLSLSISAIYEKDLADDGAVVLLEVNPNFPRTFGDTMIHISQVAGLVESNRPIPQVPPAPIRTWMPRSASTSPLWWRTAPPSSWASGTSPTPWRRSCVARSTWASTRRCSPRAWWI